VSRIGKTPITIPSGVEITLDGGHLQVKGPKGVLDMEVRPEVRLKIEESTIVVECDSEAKNDRALHGLTRSLVANMVMGVSEGFFRQLEIQGVGYRAEKPNGNEFRLALGFSHPVIYSIPEGITIEVPKPTQITVRGIDKQKVGQVAADIRRFRPPEPYKGKGVRYVDEHVHRKAGKAG
jgi:large subunit ribosomal protein L6